jgi:hypothetical protein
MSGRKSPAPVAWNGRRSGQFGTLVGATGGTQTHSRRTGSKLGQTRRTRQGLVRVSESNTKYGGKVGITGANAAPVIGPSISESSRIRKPKKLSEGPRTAAVHVSHRYTQGRAWWGRKTDTDLTCALRPADSALRPTDSNVSLRASFS